MKILKKIGLALSLMLVLVPCLNVQAKDITDNPDVGDITILPEEDLTKVPDKWVRFNLSRIDRCL